MQFGVDKIWPIALCWRLAETDVTIIPSFIGMDWLLWWHDSGSIGFLFNSIDCSHQHEWETLPVEIQVKIGERQLVWKGD